jgi:hypothetical protein
MIYDTAPERTLCAPTRPLFFDDLLRTHILSRGPHLQVMGGYALAAAARTFEPTDCDVYVRTATQQEFDTLCADIVRELPDVTSLRAPATWLRTVCVRGRAIQFIRVDARLYTHVQVCNMFDLTCCRFRMVLDGAQELRVFANNTYVRDLTLVQHKMDVFGSNTPARLRKYLARGFQINEDHRGGAYKAARSYYDVFNRPHIRKWWYVLRFIALVRRAPPSARLCS